MLRSLGLATIAAVALTSCGGPVKETASTAAAVDVPAPRARLMTQDQYLNTVSYLFGSDIKAGVRFPPLKREGGLLSVGAATAIVTPGAFEQFETGARAVADQVTSAKHRDVLVPCAPGNDAAAQRACADQFVRSTGRALFRRALTDGEAQAYVQIAAASGGQARDFYTGLSSALSAMLMSPKFLYLTGETEEDPARRGAVRLTASSKALRLSLLMWNALPDDDLLKSAETGALHKDAEVRRQVERMLASPRLEHGVRAFFTDMLAFDAFGDLAKDPVIYPAFTLKVAEDSKEQTLKTIVDHLLAQNGDYRDLFTTRKTFINGDLGMVYRLPVDRPQDWVPVEFGADSGRAGLLTQLSYLALYSHPGRSSATRRGRALREILLCQKVPDPPPNVDFTLVEDPNSTFKTTRARLLAHSQNPVCAGCHKLTDPMGLALENFDGAGQYRAAENGEQIDASGELDRVKFADAAGLGQALHDNPATVSCLVSRVSAYAMGRAMQSKDNPWLAQMAARFAADGHRMPALLRAVALDSAFFEVGAGTATVVAAK